MSIEHIKTSNLYSYRTRIYPTLKNFKYPVSASFEFNHEAKIIFIPLITQNYDYVFENIKKYKSKGSIIILDYTDNHYFVKSPHQDFYQKIYNNIEIDLVIANSVAMIDTINKIYTGPIVQIDEVLEVKPQMIQTVKENNLFWFGHMTNFKFLIQKLNQWPNISFNKLIVMTRFTNEMIPEFKKIMQYYIQKKIFKFFELYQYDPDLLIKISKDFNKILIPGSIHDELKSNISSNRLITAFALGKMVAATKVKSYEQFSNYFTDIDNDKAFREFLTKDFCYEGIEKAMNNILPNFTVQKIQEKWEMLIKNFDYLLK